jgi:hypothetical protein
MNPSEEARIAARGPIQRDMDKMRPVQRSGGWSGSHKRYRSEAHRALQQIHDARRELRTIWKELQSASEGRLLKQALDKYTGKLEDYCVLAASAQMYCAMAAEAVLNFYGVSRLGEIFYKRNVERLAVVKKFEVLMAICEGDLYSNDNDLSAVLQRIASRRNNLVHPKACELKATRDVGLGNWPDRIPDDVTNTVDEMERFLKGFSAVSENCGAAVEFFD